MSSFLEIGEIIEAIPNAVKVVNVPIKASTPLYVSKDVLSISNPDSEGNGWGWILFFTVVAGGALIYFNINKNSKIINESKGNNRQNDS